MGVHESIISRRVLGVIQDRMSEEPVIVLEGPRAVGKSTLLRHIQQMTGGTIVDLDDLPTRALAKEDPTLAISVPEPVFLDEYKHAPDLLSAIKAVLNTTGSKPGQFVLTGSSRYDTLPRTAEALTGRLHRIQVLPLSQSELHSHPGLIERLFRDGTETVTADLSPTTRADYARIMTTGGFPDVLRRRTEVAQKRWFDDYIASSLAKDVTELKKIRQAQALPKLLGVLAGQTAQILNTNHLARSADLHPDLVSSYTRLLEAVFLVRLLPAWGKTLTTRSVGNPKIHVVDSGVAARLLRLSVEKLSASDPTALTEFGHLAETFVVSEVLKETACMDGIAGVGHWRTYDDDEVDLIIERDDGQIIAMEIKVGTQANRHSFRSLAKLRDKIGDRFHVGVAFHMGQRGHQYDNRLIALPIDRFWRN